MKFFYTLLFAILSLSLSLAQKPEHIKLTGSRPVFKDPVERVQSGEQVNTSAARVGASTNDVCSEAVLLTVGTTFTCGSTSTSTVPATAFQNACVTTSGMGISEYRADWYYFNSGSSKTLAVIMNNVVNSTSFTPGLAIFGPYSTSTGGCAASMTAALCDNGLSFQADSIKILENLSQYSYYMIAVVERRNNPDRNGGASIAYCISVQETDLDDCEVLPSGCPSTCGNLCVFDQGSAPSVTNVVAGCTQKQYNKRIQGAGLASPEDTVEFCYNFRVDAGCTMSFGGVITASGCSGGNLTSANWRIYNSSTCAVASSGATVPPSAVVSTAGDYIFCMKYSAACDLQFGTYYYGYGTCAVVLPVELSQFTAQESENKIRLSWTTLSEEKNHHFEVESSGNGIDFIRIGSVKSLAENGSSSNALNYAFDDADPLYGMNYYRLKQVDIDGSFTYSKIITEQFSSAGFSVLGINQSSTGNDAQLFFENDRDEILRFSIVNLVGKINYSEDVNSRSGLNTYSIPTAHLPVGSYIIRLSNASGQVLNYKFIRF